MNTRRFLVIALLAVGAMGVPAAASAQIEAAGSTKLSMSGSGFLGSGSADLTNIFGLSRFGASGWELGGDVMLSVRRSAGTPTYEYDEWTGEMYEVEGEESSITTSGFMFGRLAYNFIGESTLVPFLSVGLGAPIESEASMVLINTGGGFKKFISERASFDVMANYQGQMVDGEISWQDGLSLFYGLSFYVGGR